jgi:hypothetical protein
MNDDGIDPSSLPTLMTSQMHRFGRQRIEAKFYEVAGRALPFHFSRKYASAG